MIYSAFALFPGLSGHFIAPNNEDKGRFSVFMCIFLRFYLFSKRRQRTVPCLLRSLFIKILNCCLEHTDVILTGNVLVKSVADTLTVSHLTEYSAVG